MLFIDGEVSRVVGDVIVAEHACRTQAGTNRVGTASNSLTRSAAISSSHAISCEEAQQGAGKGWVNAAVGLARRIGRDRSVLPVNRELSRVVGDVVVPEHTCRAKRGTDRVRTARDRLTRRAGVGGSHAIACQETYQCTGKGRISAAIDLARGIGRYRSVLLLDREVGGIVGDIVV